MQDRIENICHGNGDNRALYVNIGMNFIDV